LSPTVSNKSVKHHCEDMNSLIWQRKEH